ncbi:MAG: hypothetical protein JJU29_03095 [Verrucomicrobia bacterium]|nr:hypothetical protein [Verrucomicrobiota bacterium]MCH8511160.1 hypothetical protein [Kiritimatiellia bacterium]
MKATLILILFLPLLGFAQTSRRLPDRFVPRVERVESFLVLNASETEIIYLRKDAVLSVRIQPEEGEEADGVMVVITSAEQVAARISRTEHGLRRTDEAVGAASENKTYSFRFRDQGAARQFALSVIRGID